MDTLNKKYLKEKVNCPICNGQSKVIDNVHTINSNSFEILNLRECFNCSHWWIDPMPDQNYLLELYEKGSEYVVSPNYAGSDELKREDFEKFFNNILKYLKYKNLKKLNYLEIGCGSGYLLDYFKEKVNLCFGVEPGNWRPKETNIVSSINEIPKNIKFDIMVVKDVIEHLENPLEMMKKLNFLANNNAIISCRFPNKDSLIARFFVGRWAMIRPIGHLHFFSSKSINKMFKDSGWTIINKYSYWPVLSFFNLFKSFNWSFRNPIKFLYRFIVRLVLKQLIMGKDQWHVIGRGV